MIVEVGVPYAGWPIRAGDIYDFGIADGLLSSTLQEHALRWARFFNVHFDEASGWDSERSAADYALEGHRLIVEVERELGPGYEVRPIGFLSTA
jgi:hypothetical protein